MMALVLWLLLIVSSLPVILSHSIQLTEPDDLNNYLCCPDRSLLPDTQLLLSTDVHHNLSSSSFCLVSNTSNITIRSTSETPATITCSHHNNSYVSVGFGFYNVSGLLIDNVHITKCGGPMPSTSTLYPNDTAFYFYEDQSVTLFISYSFDITILGVNINSYYGFAILLINPNKNTTLINVSISSSGNEQCSINLLPSCGGSGLILYFSNLDNKVEVFGGHVALNNVTIQWNINLVPYSDIANAAKVHTEEPKAISAFAAGMTVIFSQGDYSVNVLLSDTHWFRDIGGVFDGLALIFSDAPLEKTSVIIAKSHFHLDVRLRARASAGIGCIVTTTRASNSCFESASDNPWNIITIVNSHVHDGHNAYRTNNNDFNSYTTNQYNHSIFYILTSSDVSKKLGIQISHLIYEQIDVGVRNPFILTETIKGHTCQFKNLHLSLQSVLMFQKNNHSLKTTLNAGKLFFVNTATVYINGDKNIFKSLTGSVIQAYNSDIHLNGTMVFYNNKASHGAAIRLDSLSHLFIHEPTNASFIKNSATFYGGAIYSHMDRNLPNINPLCAIQVVTQNISELKAKMIFKQNNAILAGNSIYMSPLYECQQLYLKGVNSKDLYNKLFHFKGEDTNHIGEISSVAVGTYVCSINNSTNITHIKVYPGKTITIGLRAFDLNGTPTSAQMFARLTKWWHYNKRYSLTYDITYLLPIEQQIQTVYSNRCTPLNFTIFSESISKIMHLHFEVLGYIPTSSVVLVPQTCPPGFLYNSKTKSCVCSSFLTEFGITQCDIDTTSVYIPPQSWLGVVDNGNIVGYTERCTPGYCLLTTIINITQPDMICKGNRMGWLCGECKKGYSVVLGSTNCYKCSNILHTIIALTFGIVGGIVYVLVLFSLRLTIDLGTIGGLIFWLNIIWPAVIPSSEIAITNTALRYMVYLLTSVKYQWNIPVCIASNFHELGKTGILYIYPVYFWLIAVVIVFLSQFSTRIANLIAGSSVQVLVTLMYISYSDLLSISLIVLTPAHIHFNSINSTGKLLVWFKDGSVLYGQNPYHALLLCVSIGVLSLFILPFTLVGLFGVKMLRSRFIAKYFRPFIDAIHGPYKEKLRYWFGVRLIVLSLIYIVIAVLQGSNMTLQLLLLIFILGSFTIVQALVLPYKNKILNTLDLWFMVLLLINFITSLSYISSENTTVNSIVTTLEIVLCSITYLVILMYHMYISMSRLRCIRKCIQHCQLTTKTKLVRKSKKASETSPLLRYEDSFQYEDWNSDN